jgi:phosphoglycerate dehydrogenase-like enzyme
VRERVAVVFESGPSFDERAWTAALEAGLPRWRGRVDARFVAGRRARRRALSEAEVFVSTWVDEDVLRRAPHLRWVHLTIAGAAGAEDLVLPADVRLTTAAGLAAQGMAEHVLALMLALDRGIAVAVDNQRRWSWTQVGILDRIGGLAGRTAGIVGLGHSGRAIARLAKSFGMRTAGVSRGGGEVEAVDSSMPVADLPRLLDASDFLVLCASLNESTRGMVGARELELLGPSSYLVNVARGELVDERALGAALRRGTIAGAAVDVLQREPPPRRHPLRGAPNLIVTPHVAGNIHTFASEIREAFVASLRAYLEDEQADV